VRGKGDISAPRRGRLRGHMKYKTETNRKEFKFRSARRALGGGARWGVEVNPKHPKSKEVPLPRGGVSEGLREVLGKGGV